MRKGHCQVADQSKYWASVETRLSRVSRRRAPSASYLPSSAWPPTTTIPQATTDAPFHLFIALSGPLLTPCRPRLKMA